MNVLAIDPGNIESAYVIMDSDTYKPVEFGKIENEMLLNLITADTCRIGEFTGRDESKYAHAVIEMVACYGMAVGKEVFDTCVWIGRFYQEIWCKTDLIVRKDVKINICNSAKAKDGNIIQALKDRFGDKGTKASPGFFYGFQADCWQAFALGATYIDKMKEKHNGNI